MLIVYILLIFSLQCATIFEYTYIIIIKLINNNSFAFVYFILLNIINLSDCFSNISVTVYRDLKPYSLSTELFALYAIIKIYI